MSMTFFCLLFFIWLAFYLLYKVNIFFKKHIFFLHLTVQIFLFYRYEKNSHIIVERQRWRANESSCRIIFEKIF